MTIPLQWLLASILLVWNTVLKPNEFFFAHAQFNIEDLTAKQFHDKLYDNNSQWFDAILDVRTAIEWNRGHVENATFMEALSSFGTWYEISKPSDLIGCEYCNLVLYCRSGARAGRAASILRQNGFLGRIYNGQGVSQWTKAGYSLVTDHNISTIPPCTIPGSGATEQCQTSYEVANGLNVDDTTSPSPSTTSPSSSPSKGPTIFPNTGIPSNLPTTYPSAVPSGVPTKNPTAAPSESPSNAPISSQPATAYPSVSPSAEPSLSPSSAPNNILMGVTERLSATTFYERLNDPDVQWFDVVIDVRSMAEWNSGRIANTTFMEGLASYPLLTYSSPTDLSGCEYCNIAIYCNSGNRAGRAIDVLRQAGFVGNLYNGLGVLQWTRAGYPLVTEGDSVVPPCTMVSINAGEQCFQRFQDQQAASPSSSPTLSPNEPTTPGPTIVPSDVPSDAPSTVPGAVDVDNYSIKATPIVSQLWSVSYFDTYKIVSNYYANATYLLYRKGTDIPNLDMIFDLEMEVPVSNVGVEDSTSIPFLEQLNVLNQLAVVTQNESYFASPCVLELIENGDVPVIRSQQDLVAWVWASNAATIDRERLQSSLIFRNYDESTTTLLFPNTIAVSEFAESTNAGALEWIKFYSTFFDLEGEANEIFERNRATSNCISEYAAVASMTMNISTVTNETTTTSSKPRVIWASYSYFCGGWNVAECPNYYCEYAEHCQAELILYAGDDVQWNQACGINVISTSQFVAMAQDAEYWVYSGDGWEWTYSTLRDQLDTLKSVQNGQVYDTQGYGAKAWDERRFVDQNSIIVDFCTMVGTVASPRMTGDSWFRNVLDGSLVGSLGGCSSNLTETNGLDCPLSSDSPSTSPSVSPSTSTNSAQHTVPRDDPSSLRATSAATGAVSSWLLVTGWFFLFQ